MSRAVCSLPMPDAATPRERRTAGPAAGRRIGLEPGLPPEMRDPEFWVGAVHDLRSPLASILCLADALRGGRSGPVNETQRRQLALVYAAALGLARVASDLLESARGGDALAGEERGAVSLTELLDSVGPIVQPLAEVKGVELRLEAPADDARWCEHPLALSRVLLNLTTNALKATEEGYVEVTARPRGARRVEFSVRDTGPGLKPELLDALHGSRERVQARKGHGFSSSGLGLDIARRLVAAMGARLHVESDRETGTRFSFELELLPVEERACARGALEPVG